MNLKHCGKNCHWNLEKYVAWHSDKQMHTMQCGCGKRLTDSHGRDSIDRPFELIERYRHSDSRTLHTHMCRLYYCGTHACDLYIHTCSQPYVLFLRAWHYTHALRQPRLFSYAVITLISRNLDLERERERYHVWCEWSRSEMQLHWFVSCADFSFFHPLFMPRLLRMKTFISWIMSQFYNPPCMTPAGLNPGLQRVTGVKSGLIIN